MIVSQAQHELWENMYVNRNGNTTEQKPEDVTDSSQVEKGQSLAVAGNSPQPERKTHSDEAETLDEMSYLEQVFEKVLLNRLGIDHEKMEELKEEIEKTEDALNALYKHQPPNDAQQNEIVRLEEKLETLQKALEELVKQANERNQNEQQFGHQDGVKSAAKYQSVATLM